MPIRAINPHFLTVGKPVVIPIKVRMQPTALPTPTLDSVAVEHTAPVILPGMEVTGVSCCYRMTRTRQ